ncbi:hypothetical protein MW887_004004 [Aspergillus wentii]|nr:hypothetical protein MW887_004004 [Aspergillus wentii]
MDSLASSPDCHKKSTWDNQLGVNQRTLHESAWDTYEQLRSFYTNRLIILSGFEQHEAATVCSFASTAVKRLVQNSESTLQVALDNVDSWAGNPQDEIAKWVDDVQKLAAQTLDKIHQDLEVYKE